MTDAFGYARKNKTGGNFLNREVLMSFLWTPSSNHFDEIFLCYLIALKRQKFFTSCFWFIHPNSFSRKQVLFVELVKVWDAKNVSISMQM
jgi:hypothetical protein